MAAASAAGWMHAPAWALALGIAWGALAGELPDIDHRRARVSRARSAFGIAGPLLGIPVRIVGAFIRGLRVTHRGPTHSLTLLVLWAAIAAPLYMACGGVMVLALAWAAGKLAAIAHTGTPVRAPAAIPWLLGHLAVVYPYAAVTTALGYVSHLVLDSLTGPIPWAGRSLLRASRSYPLRSGSALAPRSRPGCCGRRSPSLPSSRFSQSRDYRPFRTDLDHLPPPSTSSWVSLTSRS